MQPRDVIIAGRKVRLYPSQDGSLWVSDPKLIDICAERQALGEAGHVPHVMLSPRIVEARERARASSMRSRRAEGKTKRRAA